MFIHICRNSPLEEGEAFRDMQLVEASLEVHILGEIAGEDMVLIEMIDNSHPHMAVVEAMIAVIPVGATLVIGTLTFSPPSLADQQDRLDPMWEA